ncbi:MAG: sulfatase-like hydrolase/transferase [Halobaculum sp.]
MSQTLLVTVDSLRYDCLDRMPATKGALGSWHDHAYATCTATLGSFPAIVGGQYADGSELRAGASVANAFDCRTVGITTNHFLSPRYGYDDGFDSFSSPHGGGSLKDRVADRLTVGSPVYRVASAAYNAVQSVRDQFDGVSKSFRPADDVIDEFLGTVSMDDEWFGWLHFMEPHYPYDPDGGGVSRSRAQALSRRVVAGDGTPEENELVRELYQREVAELDSALARLWDTIPGDATVVFSADHGELLGEDGLWGHPGVVRPELLHVPYGMRNTPSPGELVSTIDTPTLLTGAEWGEGTFDRSVAYASYGDTRVAINRDAIASTDGTTTHDGQPTDAPQLERKLARFDSGSVVKEDAAEEDLEELGYL